METQTHYIEQKHLLSLKTQEVKEEIQKLIKEFEAETNSRLLVTNFMPDRELDVMLCINQEDFINLNLKEK